MVKEKPTIIYSCEKCGTEYKFLEGAQSCENRPVVDFKHKIGDIATTCFKNKKVKIIGRRLEPSGGTYLINNEMTHCHGNYYVVEYENGQKGELLELYDGMLLDYWLTD